jgi:cholesterol transport system auxiliary component
MKKSYLYGLIVVGLTISGILFGCVNLRRDYPIRTFYVLAAKPDTVRPPEEDGPVLQVQLFRASPGFSSSEFVYRTGESIFESDSYHAFFTLPSDQIRALTSQWIQDSGRARAVLDRSSRLRPTNVIEGNLVALYGDFRDEENPRAVIELEFLLMDIKPITPRIVFSKSYQESIAIPESTAAALVNGWNEGLKKILTAFTGDIPEQEAEADEKPATD